MRIFFSILLLLFTATACAARLPSPTRTTQLIRHHFNGYAKEYETSIFGKKKVANIEILKMEEIHKHFISVQAFVTMQGPATETSSGTDVHKVLVQIEKGPFGWRYVAWENLGGT